MKEKVVAKTAIGKRILKKREPQFVEDDKYTVVIRGKKTSGQLSSLLADLNALKKPLSVKLQRQESVQPFLDFSTLEYLANKNGCALVMFGDSSKKRPLSLVLGRTFKEQMLDMSELTVSNYVPSSQFSSTAAPCKLGAKPLILFQGSHFAQETSQSHRTRNMLIDAFRGVAPKAVSLEGLEHVIVISSIDDSASNESLAAPLLLSFRCFRLALKRGGGEGAAVISKLPYVELSEMGPRFDFKLGREHMPDFVNWKESLRKPRNLSTTQRILTGETQQTAAREAEKRRNKNITRDNLGNTMGRIHVGRQDYTKLNTVHRLEKHPKKKFNDGDKPKVSKLKLKKK